MPFLRTEEWGAGDLSWLGSAHGIWNCRTVTLDISAFTPSSTYHPNGHIRAGTPLQRLASGLYGPYSGTGLFSGFLFTDQQVHGTADLPAPLLDHGRVKLGNLPISGFVVPTAANNQTTIVFLAAEGS